MSMTPKPPMTVWLNHRNPPFLATSTERSQVTPDGPYIHLDQFLAEVERRANLNPKTRSWDMSLGEAKAEAMQELAKEIKEQNEN